MLFYAAGLGLDRGACWLGAAARRLPLPPRLGGVLAAPLFLPQLLGMALEAFHLGLLAFLGGATGGFVRGVWSGLNMPCVLAWHVLRGGSRWLRCGMHMI